MMLLMLLKHHCCLSWPKSVSHHLNWNRGCKMINCSGREGAKLAQCLVLLALTESDFRHSEGQARFAE